MPAEPGSAPLENARHEKMVQSYAAGGLDKTEAHQRAGFLRDKSNANRAFSRPEVELRLMFLQQKASDAVVEVVRESAEQVALTREFVIAKLMKNARVALGEETTIVKRIGAGGKPVKVEVTLHDAGAANRALHLLGLEVGMFKTETAPPPQEQIDAARNAQDPKIAEQLKRYAANGPRLLTIDGGKAAKAPG